MARHITTVFAAVIVVVIFSLFFPPHTLAHPFPHRSPSAHPFYHTPPSVDPTGGAGGGSSFYTSPSTDPGDFFQTVSSDDPGDRAGPEDSRVLNDPTDRDDDDASDTDGSGPGSPDHTEDPVDLADDDSDSAETQLGSAGPETLSVPASPDIIPSSPASPDSPEILLHPVGPGALPAPANLEKETLPSPAGPGTLSTVPSPVGPPSPPSPPSPASPEIPPSPPSPPTPGTPETAPNTPNPASPETQPNTAISAVSPPPGYTRTLFLEDFSLLKPGSLPSKWSVSVGTSYPGGPPRWGTGEVQTYTSSAANIGITASGTLKITPQVSTSPRGRNQEAEQHWTSARIETKPAYDFACEAGKKLRIEGLIRLPGPAATPFQMGIWPAFWSLGAALRGNYMSWPAVGEIDIIESTNGLATAYHTVHCGTSGSGGPCKEPSGIGGQSGLSRGDWHVAAVEIDRSNAGGNDWRGEKMTWLVDGRQTFSITGATVGDAAAWTSLARTPKFLLLNVAVGGSFPDAIARVKTPTPATAGGDTAAMEVRYVAVFAT